MDSSGVAAAIKEFFATLARMDPLDVPDYKKLREILTRDLKKLGSDMNKLDFKTETTEVKSPVKKRGVASKKKQPAAAAASVESLVDDDRDDGDGDKTDGEEEDVPLVKKGKRKLTHVKSEPKTETEEEITLVKTRGAASKKKLPAAASMDSLLDNDDTTDEEEVRPLAKNGKRKLTHGKSEFKAETTEMKAPVKKRVAVSKKKLAPAASMDSLLDHHDDDDEMDGEEEAPLVKRGRQNLNKPTHGKSEEILNGTKGW